MKTLEILTNGYPKYPKMMGLGKGISFQICLFCHFANLPWNISGKVGYSNATEKIFRHSSPNGQKTEAPALDVVG